ncbi:transmembrane protein 234 homolog [Sitophilus oryzae]|uniref:Transmembrane protein 234 homolog n=1 Tax=Sitophilus oryzae TaxID=7048 RepID=A0A6J2XHW8_SITOR|nr:transmembrane protein 234 homolog [Sitophilus oryzae]
MIYEALALIAVSALWGITNPLIKKNSSDITKIQSDSHIKQFLLEIKYLLTNIKYIMPMTCNQIGSVIYFITLQHVDLTLSVPIANSLTFFFTALTGFFLKETLPSKKTIIGMVFILIGTLFCCYDKYLLKEERVE